MSKPDKRGGLGFAFEKFGKLTVEDLLEESTEFLIPDLLVKNSITMWYSKPSQGKTWFTYAVAKKLMQCYADMRHMYYCDFDNGKRQIKERNVHEEIMQNEEKFTYMHKGSVDATPQEFIEAINKEAFGQNLKDVVFIFDSTRDFVDNIHNDLQAKRFMQIMKNIREAGGTVILIHHTSKSGKVIDGSGEFTKSTDNAFELVQTGKTPGKIHYLLKVTNDRDSVQECAFSVLLEKLELTELDPVIGAMTQEEKEFVKNCTEVLAKHKAGLNQSQLLEKLGYKRDNKKARERLDKYVGIFYTRDASKKPYIYTVQ